MRSMDLKNQPRANIICPPLARKKIVSAQGQYLESTVYQSVSKTYLLFLIQWQPAPVKKHKIPRILRGYSTQAYGKMQELSPRLGPPCRAPKDAFI